jgi:Na+/melibiose symporter-like transporter
MAALLMLYNLTEKRHAEIVADIKVRGGIRAGK